LRLILHSCVSPDSHHKYLTTRRQQRHARKGKCSRSVRKDYDTLNVQRQVSLRYSAHLRVIDLCRRGRRRPEDATPRAGTRAPGSGFIIDIRRILLRIGSCAESYICTAKIVRGIPVMTSILWSLVRASSSSLLASTPDPDSSDDYPQNGASSCGELTEAGRLICMVASNCDRSHNSSSRYPTIGRLEASDARTLSGSLVRNLNPDFNAVQV
jgi:hypothetical protein